MHVPEHSTRQRCHTYSILQRWQTCEIHGFHGDRNTFFAASRFRSWTKHEKPPLEVDLRESVERHDGDDVAVAMGVMQQFFREQNVRALRSLFRQSSTTRVFKCVQDVILMAFPDWIDCSSISIKIIDL